MYLTAQLQVSFIFPPPLYAIARSLSGGMLNNMCVCVFNAILLKRCASPSIAYSASRIGKLKTASFQAMRTSAEAVSGSADSRKRCGGGQPAAQATTSITKPDDKEAMKRFTSADAAAPSEGETSKTENGQGCESSLPEPRSAGQPASLHDHVPTFLRNTALGTVLLDRMIWESWQPIMVDDIP